MERYSNVQKEYLMSKAILEVLELESRRKVETKSDRVEMGSDYMLDAEILEVARKVFNKAEDDILKQALVSIPDKDQRSLIARVVRADDALKNAVIQTQLTFEER